MISNKGPSNDEALGFHFLTFLIFKNVVTIPT